MRKSKRRESAAPTEPSRRIASKSSTLGWLPLWWSLLAAPVAATVGSACALFLWSLDVVTQARWDHPWLLYLLPVAGLLVAALYHWLGESVAAGNNLILDEIHEPGGGVPLRMAPLIFLGTLLTHLCGGSAGREGTAVQMAGGIAGEFGRRLHLKQRDLRVLLMCGVAAGFGGVFGTPVAGAVFALEVLTVGRIRHGELLPCLAASCIGDWACAAWGVHHTDYHQLIQTVPRLEWVLAAKVVLAAVAFGLVSRFFVAATHGLHVLAARSIASPLLRPVVGGLLVIVLVHILGARDYLGLGVVAPLGEPYGVSILSSFRPGGAGGLAWWWKLTFTVITLGSGFKGGEVTPLFFIGATLGNALAWALDAPVDLFAALGFVAVFAGATKTPLACTIMGLELFGAGGAVYLALACTVAYVASGETGIYHAQRRLPKRSIADIGGD